MKIEGMDQALQAFLAESRELLESMEEALLRLEGDTADAETINAIFRSAHTIKGSSGLFGLDGIVAFTHVVESVLDRVRDGKIPLDAELITLLLESSDHIGSLVDGVETGTAADPAAGEPLLVRLRPYLGQPQAAKPVTAAPVADVSTGSSGGNRASADNWHISLRFARDVLRHGMDPLSFIRYLSTFGVLVNVQVVTDALPPGDAYDPESCYLGFEINYRTDADKTRIESAFEFVRDDCVIRILPPRSLIGEYVDHIRELPEEDIRIGEMLVRCGTLTRHELEQALREQAEAAAAGSASGGTSALQPIGEILVADKVVQPSVVAAALDKQKEVKEHKSVESRMVRVDADKLDQLIDLVGELVIANAGMDTIARRAGHAGVIESLAGVQRLVGEVRDGALGLRMVQIGNTFNRFQRVVRDVSKDLGKEIGLDISGAETDLDKSVVEKINDPLMHLVRNAMDHGIETPDERVRKGKPARGTLRLNAYHDSGSVVIEVADDGAGLDRDRILRKAIEKGIVSDVAVLTNEEVHNLIFEPGFSTAEQVSNLSGRGVGMDVVRRNIESLRGHVEIDTELGKGTTIRIRLPLTLAIIDGFLVGVGQAAFIIPLETVEECIELNGSGREEAVGHNFINLRGEVLPFIRLREFFKVRGELSRRENLVVVKYGRHRCGFVVERLMGELQTVIKPLGNMFNHVRGLGGSTILGSGEVALILDVPGLTQHAVAREAGADSVRSAAA